MSTLRTATIMMAVASLATLAACNVDGPTAPARSQARLSTADPLARRQGPGGDCIIVSGTIDEWSFTYPLAASGTVTGFFSGTASAEMAYTGNEKNAAAYTGTRTFTTSFGTLSMSGVMTSREQKILYHRLTGDYTITGGTGGYEGASGEIQITGTASYNGLDFGAHLEYKGEVCGPLNI